MIGSGAEGDSWLDRQVSPFFLFITGLALAPALILQKNIPVKAAQAALFLVLALLSRQARGKRLLIGSLVFMLTTVLVNLLSPFGKVLLQLGPIALTEGALRVGLSKALTLAGLIFVSRLCVRSSLPLPGSLGRYVSTTFFYLNELLSRREKVKKTNLVERLDEIFHTVYKKEQASGNNPRRKNTPAGMLFLGLLLAVTWSPVFFPV